MVRINYTPTIVALVESIEEGGFPVPWLTRAQVVTLVVTTDCMRSTWCLFHSAFIYILKNQNMDLVFMKQTFKIIEKRVQVGKDENRNTKENSCFAP